MHTLAVAYLVILAAISVAPKISGAGRGRPIDLAHGAAGVVDREQKSDGGIAVALELGAIVGLLGGGLAQLGNAIDHADGAQIISYLVIAGQHQEQAQDESKASYEGWYHEEQSRINWAKGTGCTPTWFQLGSLACRPGS